MDTMTDRMVMVPARALDDLCSLAELAAAFRSEEQGHEDSLVNGLRGSAREVRARAGLVPSV
jgi:hypothetical protein